MSIPEVYYCQNDKNTAIENDCLLCAKKVELIKEIDMH